MKTKILCFFLFFSSILCGQDWALQDPTLGWNKRQLVALYFHNSELQTQGAWGALSNYRFHGTERILDFGTGDGKIAALISRMVSNKVHGVDISKEMIFYASKMFPIRDYKNLEFSLSSIDFSDMFFPEKFDVVTSFYVFHLLPNPSKILSNIKNHMQPHGKLIITFPIGKNFEFYRAASEEMALRGWDFPAATEESQQMRDPEKIQQILKDAGFDVEYFQVREERSPFNSKEELVDWFEGTCTANWNIPSEEQRDFFSGLTDRLLTYRPQDQDEDGFVYFYLKYVDIIATPKKG